MEEKEDDVKEGELFKTFQEFRETIAIREEPFLLEPLSTERKEPPPDLFSIVKEWTSLRGEVQRQNKLQHESLLAMGKTWEKEVVFAKKEQEEKAGWIKKIFIELFPILDQLDYAIRYWEGANRNYQKDPLWGGKSLLLPVLDQLDYAIRHWEEANRNQEKESAPLLPLKEKSFPVSGEVLEKGVQGLKGIKLRFISWLSIYEITPYSCLGKKFDPETMMAIKQQEVTEEKEINLVCEEILQGYFWKEDVLRVSEVVVTVKNIKTI